MAGGSGTRFWPLSRKKTPKQVLSITGQNSLLRDTVERITGLIPRERTLIVTNRLQTKAIKPLLPEMTDDNYILEPSSRNTAPCIGLAATHLLRKDPDAIMLVMPSDHLVREADAFRNVISKGVEVVYKHDALVTIGIPPTRPETGYGYVQFDDSPSDLPEGVYKVKAFAEKPNLPTAERFVIAGDFFWNSGIFIWHASRILSEMEEHLPEQYHQLKEIDAAWDSSTYQRVLSSRYHRIRQISIDYGIMESTTTPIFMLRGDFGWSDVGSWDELYRISPKDRNGNVLVGETLTLNAKSDFVYSPNRLTAIVGIDDILVVNTAGATLICKIDRAQDVKELVEKLRKEGKDRFL